MKQVLLRLGEDPMRLGPLPKRLELWRRPPLPGSEVSSMLRQHFRERHPVRSAAAAGRGTSDWLRKRYFAGFFLFFASARRSVFFRRAARFLTLSLPWLCPIIPNTLCRLHQTSNIKSARGRIRRGEHQKFFGDTHPPVAPPRHVEVLTKTRSNS